MEDLRASFQMLDVNVSLVSDSSELMGLFERDYGMFLTSFPEGPVDIDVIIRLNCEVPAIIVDDEEIPFGARTRPYSYARHIILRELFKRVKEFYILHAGVVAKNKRALILSGPPGAGKTTLVMRLIDEGYKLLSDDYCPVHKETGEIYPFPRSLWRKVPISLSERACLHSYGKRNNKVPIRADKFKSRIINEPCRPSCLVCLEAGSTARHFWELEIGFKGGAEKAFMADIENLKKNMAVGAQLAEENKILTINRLNGEFSEWRIRYPKGLGITKEIRKIIDRRRDEILDVYSIDTMQPDFERIPVLTPISLHEAAFFLLGELKQSFPFGRETSVSEKTPGVFFTRLASILEKVPCYRLSVGRLDEMISLIKEIPA